MIFLTVPHSGEHIPSEASWLHGIDQQILLTDIDRFVDELYLPASQELGIPMSVMHIHRYVIDLNRFPTDIDGNSVAGSPPNSTPFVSGFHWVKTTQNQVLMKTPISLKLHQELTDKYYEPFHAQVRALDLKIFNEHQIRFHIDAHSMPSKGTAAHKDKGELRADVVVSDCNGTSCSSFFKDIVLEAFNQQGMRTSYNWPYTGGRMTQQYGNPKNNRHSIQIELNRALYMDEATKNKKPEFQAIAEKIKNAMRYIASNCR